MKEKTFIKFFLYSSGVCIALGIIFLVYAKIFQLETPCLYVILYLGFCLYFGLGMGIFGHFYAKNMTLTISNSHKNIHDFGSLLDSKKYIKLNETNNELVFGSSKFYEWFYGKVHIKNSNNEITINAAKCIINKYFATIK